MRAVCVCVDGVVEVFRQGVFKHVQASTEGLIRVTESYLDSSDRCSAFVKKIRLCVARYNGGSHTFATHYGRLASRPLGRLLLYKRSS